MTSLQTQIQTDLAQFYPEFDRVLAPLTYFKIGGLAEVYFDLKSRAALIEVIQWCLSHHSHFILLGGASNVIVNSEGIPGVVIRTSNQEYELLPSPDKKTGVIRVGGGYKTSLFVRRTIDDGFGGLEYFLGVPGRVGGAVYNNAHYLSNLIGTHIIRVEVISATGEVHWISHQDCDFSYDHSRFHTSDEVIVQAEFGLAQADQVNSLELVKAATLYRAQTQPLGEPSSGCYFRNTPNTPTLRARFPQFAARSECPAAFLIDQAGLKGTTVGGIAVSHKHAAFFINTGAGTSQEVSQLAEIVKRSVRDQFGVELKEEVFFLK